MLISLTLLAKSWSPKPEHPKPRKLIINKKKTRDENEFKLYVLSILMSYSHQIGRMREKVAEIFLRWQEGNSKFQQFNLIAYACKSAAAAKGKQH